MADLRPRTPILYLPDFKEFSRLAADATLVPVVRTIPADLLTPVAAFLSISHDEPNAFLLESVEGGEKIGRYTFIGIRPYQVISSRGRQISIQKGKRTEKYEGDIFETLRDLFSEHRTARVPGLPPFTCGAVGYFAYDAVRQLEKLPDNTKDDLKTPDCQLMFFDRLLAFDRVRQQIVIVATADVRGGNLRKAYDGALKGIAELESRIKAGVPRKALKSPKPVSGKLRLDHKTSRSGFLKDVRRIKQYILAGDVFQTVLSQRIEMEPGVAPFDIYRALRTVNPSPYMYFLRMGELNILGSSPEMLLKANGDALQYRPIAGTRPRGADDAEDQRLEAELRADPKECAEHVMLVDLGRNDLGRVSQTGTVKVKDFMFVERYSHVMHLVSALEGRLCPDLTPLDAFAACFPAGTLTGAPKIRSMEIIEELEPVRRGLYGGSIFYADFSGNLDSCIAIRTMLMKGKRAYVQAGAGIVADSIPESEYDECINKAQALVRAVEIARKLGS